jgi:hypothetical protein
MWGVKSGCVTDALLRVGWWLLGWGLVLGLGCRRGRLPVKLPSLPQWAGGKWLAHQKSFWNSVPAVEGIVVLEADLSSNKLTFGLVHQEEKRVQTRVISLESDAEGELEIAITNTEFSVDLSVYLLDLSCFVFASYRIPKTRLYSDELFTESSQYQKPLTKSVVEKRGEDSCRSSQPLGKCSDYLRILLRLASTKKSFLWAEAVGRGVDVK